MPSTCGEPAEYSHLDLHGVQGVQLGSQNIQINVFYRESSSINWPCQIGVIPLLADCFQERPQETTRLREALTQGQTAVLTQVLSGLGGVGKTQLAAAHARHMWAAAETDLLVWISANTRDAVQATYARASREISQVAPTSIEEATDWFLGWLQNTERRWLIVLDDVSDPAHLRGLWPNGRSGQVVITTRRRDATLSSGGRQMVEIGVFSEDEASTYLSEKLHGDQDLLAESEELAAELGYLPLAMSQAATFMRDRRETCSGYRQRLADRRRSLQELMPGDALADDYSASVATTWSISIELADRLTPARLASPTLELASILHPNGAPIDVLTAQAALKFVASVGGYPPPSNDGAADYRRLSQDCIDTITNLHRLNLLTFDPAVRPRAVRMHALIQRATLEQRSAERIKAIVHAAADALVEIWPEVERDAELSQSLRDSATKMNDQHGQALWDREIHPIVFRLGRSLGECGLVNAAIDFWGAVATKADRIFGEDDNCTLSARYWLASWRGESGDTDGAIVAFEQLLADRLRVSGPDHPETLKAREHLASWRGEAGDLEGTISAIKQLLADRIRALGPDHPDTLSTQGNLAYWRGAAGDSAGAVTAFEQVLADRSRILGPDHPDTLSARSNVSRWRGVSGDAEGAVMVAKQLLADRMRVLGADHPATMNTRQDLAYWRGIAGDPNGAAAALEQLLADRIRVLGPHHPDSLNTLQYLAYWRGASGDLVGTVAAAEELLANRTRAQGPNRP